MTRIMICEMDPLRDMCIELAWRLKNLKVDIKGFLLKNWTHGVLQFDFKIGGVTDSHKSNLLAIECFREMFAKGDTKKKEKSKENKKN